MGDSVMIVGASARAAAFSALRAGLRPTAIDLFADRDLAAVCPVRRVTGRYPTSLPALAREGPTGPWIYTGGLENRPEIVERISRERPLWGNDAASLRRARDPFALFASLREAGIPCPAVTRTGKSADGQWLVKPLAGTGGNGIHVATDRSPRRSSYLQRFLPGEAWSGVFVADESGGRLLGVTRQLVGVDWLHSSSFRYAGSIGPLTLTRSERSSWHQLGTAIAGFAGLRGLFGVDAIVRDGVPWPVEVNPRYTASMEVIEYATGIRALAHHRQAFAEAVRAGSESPEVFQEPSLTLPARTVVGKAIWYAPRPITFPRVGPWDDVLCESVAIKGPPAFADIPSPDERIAAGRPVLTLFAVAATVADCEQELRGRAAELNALLLGWRHEAQ
jgi:predicted ATP-grasp superfamily ATP-dependent carboligase